LKKLSYDFVKNNIESEGYKLLSEEYKNVFDLLSITCPNGHNIELSWQKWNIGRRCKYCNKSLCIEDIRKDIESKGCKLLADVFKSSKDKLKIMLPNGTIIFKSWSKWRTSSINNKLKNICITVPSFEEFNKEVLYEGYKILSDKLDHIHGKSKFKMMCPYGHIMDKTYSSWKSGYRCYKCSRKKVGDLYRLPYELIKISFEKDNYELISQSYDNAFTKLDYICPNGHHHSIRWNDWQQGCRCPECNTYSSKGELELSEFIKSLVSKTITNDRTIISPYELDIVIPEKKIAIEYCGLYWHSELAGINSRYHLNKLELCNKQSYRLITIFEDEWVHKKDIVKNRLRHILGSNNVNKIYGRQCQIKEISIDMKNKFLDDYHIQGKDISKVRLGAFYNDTLVSVMTFSHGSISKGSKKEDNIWELNRFCIHQSFSIVGVASKLLKYFEKNYEWRKIFSYADRRWSIGNVYIKLGFDLSYITKPNYWYTDGSLKRIHRFNLRKSSIDPKDKTELELRRSQGYFRIWDCGNLKYIKLNKGDLYGKEIENHGILRLSN
jgi:hypothetical protein